MFVFSSLHATNKSPIKASPRVAAALREAVTALPGIGIIVLDLTEVSAIDASGVDMLLFLQQWACDCDIQVKLFNPKMSVRDRLERVSSMPQFHIVTLPEVLALMVNTTSFVLAP